jgi:RHS repeat-associated protein
MKSLPPNPSRSNETICFHAGDYSFGFNGKDKESEFNSGAYDFGARIHDARLGRWMSVDDKYFRHFELSPFCFSNNNPVNYADIDGDDFIAAKKLQPSVESHLKLAFKTTEGISWKGNKMVVDVQKYRAAAEKANGGQLSQEQDYLFRKFIEGQVVSKEIRITYTENKETDTATSGEINSKTYQKATEDGLAINSININDSQKNFEEKINDTESGTVVKSDGTELTSDEKRAIAFWHEVGHIHIWKSYSSNREKHQMQAVGFENIFRTIIGATLRLGKFHGKQNSDGSYPESGSEAPEDAPNTNEVKK